MFVGDLGPLLLLPFFFLYDILKNNIIMFQLYGVGLCCLRWWFVWRGFTDFPVIIYRSTRETRAIVGTMKQGDSGKG